jgi:hypothetical protein
MILGGELTVWHCNAKPAADEPVVTLADDPILKEGDEIRLVTMRETGAGWDRIV